MTAPVELPAVRIDTNGDVVEDLAIFGADLVRIENLGSRYWVQITAHGVEHEFSIYAQRKGVPVVVLEESEPITQEESDV